MHVAVLAPMPARATQPIPLSYRAGHVPLGTGNTEKMAQEWPREPRLSPVRASF